MDDELSLPTSQIQSQNPEQSLELSSDEEDGAPDWAKFLSSTSSKKSKDRQTGQVSIPKRGNKEFEPSTGFGEGSNLQSVVLSRARDAMLSVLKTAERKSVARTMSFGIWVPEISRAYVTVQRGTLWQTMGHSAPREKKRLELLPEDALYLIERGNLWCTFEGQQIPGTEDEVPGPPISAQEAFTEMIGKEGLTLEKYEVYAYLRRLGYIVTRTKAPAPYYPLPPSFIPSSILRQRTIWGLLKHVLLYPYTIAQKTFVHWRNFPWWAPLSRSIQSCWSYSQLFTSLRSVPIPQGHATPLYQTQPPGPESHYVAGPFYNVWKPGTSYRKTQPDKRPDYQITVVDARITRMPSLAEFKVLYDMLDDAPPPVSRKYPTSSNTQVVPSSSSWYESLLNILFQRDKGRPKQPPRTNPFPHLRQGSKMAIIAVVDSGSVGFFRFGRGTFQDWPMNLGA